MSDKGQKAAIIPGGSQGIGASLVTAYHRQNWRVAATERPLCQVRAAFPAAGACR